MARRFLALLLVMAAFAVTTSPAQAAPSEGYRPPVDAPVDDGFRPPTSPYGPQNLGLHYVVDNLTEVRASASGTVVYAGRVGGVGFVTIQHADGLRTTYGNIVRIDVTAGDRVAGSEVVGRSGTWVHFSVRDGDVYLDPALIFGHFEIEVHLVPHDDSALDAAALAIAERSEQERLLELLASGGGGGLFGRIGAALMDAVSSGVVSVMTHYAMELLEPEWIQWTMDVAAIMFLPEPPCTPVSTAVLPPIERRIAIEVSGLGSQAGGGSIVGLDTATLGYDDEDVVQYSYRGGAVDGRGGWQDGLERSDYGSSDTHQSIVVSAGRLRELIAAVSAANPGVPIDLYAHSLGGLVTQYAVSGDGHESIDGLVTSIVTFGTPHQGSIVATIGDALGSTAIGSDVLDATTLVADRGQGTPAVEQLSEASDFIANLRPFPPGIHSLTVGARGDLLVNPRSTVVPGTSNVVISAGLNAHANLPRDADATRAAQLHLAGRYPACRSRWDRFLDVTANATHEDFGDTAGLAVLVLGQAADPLPR